MKMKKWIKYIAVVSCFLIMAGIFVPDSASKVMASELENVQEIEEPIDEQNTIVYSFVLGDGATWVDGNGTPVNVNWTIGPGSGNVYNIAIPDYIPTKENSVFNGWQYTASYIESMESGTAAAGQTIKIDGTKVSAGATITFTAQWSENGESTDKIISDTGTYSLNQGEQYTLGDGRWTVSGDNGSTEYVGGNQFYVGTTGDYTFTKTDG